MHNRPGSSVAPSRLLYAALLLPATLSFARPMPPAASLDHRRGAIAAVADLLKHFWVGSPGSGHILDTYGGYDRKDDPRGILWERATFQSVLFNLYDLTRDPTVKQRIAADWAHVTAQITAKELESCGKGWHNPGCDDAGWAATMYVNVYRATGDRAALDHARGLFDCAYDRWVDAKLGGGMWYNDARQFKASYQAALILVGIRLYEVTKDEQVRDRAQAIYEWVEKNMLRPDGLYWCEMWPSGPQSVGGIKEGTSVTFLGGNMAMGVIHARLYRDTGKTLYRDRARRTAAAILSHESDGAGHYVDDRDAWANGFFMGEWAREVLTLRDIGPEHTAMLRATSEAIAARDRTPAGYYGGCWNGPPEGDGCPWYKTSKPEQIMTSASAVNVLVAASLAESGKPWPSR